MSAVGLRVEFAARMSRRIRIFQVDAFTTERFTGNPAGVVLDADSLTDAEMLAIARELNNADTAFVLKPDGTDHELRVRFFTPRTEAGFVGHATVATHFVLSGDGARSHVKGSRLRQKQKSGLVDVEIRGEGATRRIAIRQPPPPLGRQLNDRERLAVLDALALSTGDIDTRCPLRIVGGSGTRLMIGVRGSEQLRQLKAIAEKYHDAQERFIAAPWTSDDGDPFADGKHLALTRWSADADNPGDQDKQRGNWQYCGSVSGEVVSDFFSKWPNAESPEPGIM